MHNSVILQRTDINALKQHRLNLLLHWSEHHEQLFPATLASVRFTPLHFTETLATRACRRHEQQCLTSSGYDSSHIYHQFPTASQDNPHRMFSISLSFSLSRLSMSDLSCARALLAASRRAWASLSASRMSPSSEARLSRSLSNCTRIMVSSDTWRDRPLLLSSASCRAPVKGGIALDIIGKVVLGTKIKSFGNCHRVRKENGVIPEPVSSVTINQYRDK